MSLRKAMLMNLLSSPITTPRSYQIFFIGDSLTAGIGTTGTGSSSSGDYYGLNSYPVKTLDKLADLTTVSPVYRGFPGELLTHWSTLDMPRSFNMIEYENFTDIYMVLFWGANDLTITVPADFESQYITTIAAIKAMGIVPIIVPIFSRKDSYAEGVGYINIPRRNEVNTWLEANQETYGYTLVDLTSHPEIFSDDAPDDETYFVTADIDGLGKVHFTDAGADILATCVSDTILSLSTVPSIPITLVDYAQEFIDAAGIVDSTEIEALQTFVTSLLSSGLWYKLGAIYPFIGSTSNSHKYNLRDPRDSDDAYRLIYNGTPVHDANGITFASSSYVNTKYSQMFQAIMHAKNCSLSYYSKTALPLVEGVDMGQDAFGPAWLGIKLGGNAYFTLNGGPGSGSGVSVGYTATGLFTTSRANDMENSKLYRNGSIIATEAVHTTQPPVNGLTYPMWIGGANNSGSHSYPSSRNCAYAAIGYGLTGIEEATHYTIIQAFQTTLGRAV